MLLDTCALLWLAEGGRRLSTEARRSINAATVVYVSAISAFEIGIKHRFGKLRLPALPGEWFQAVLTQHDLAEVPLDIATCTTATELPLIHRDPCDRFIIATARLREWPVVTADTRFASYGIDVIW